ncbi:MAG: CpaD family pilus assembly protein [Hyphomicrobiales bacterium]|nr:CpaD family pilus assembly protein [Hyphomicrobiales bacterium]
MQKTVSVLHHGNDRSLPPRWLGAGVFAVACTLLLAGCGQNREITGSVPMSYQDRHPIVVQHAAETLSIPVDVHGGRLIAADRTMISDFVRGHRADGDGPLFLLAPSGSANETAAAYTVREVRQVLVDLGYGGNIVTQSYQAADPDTAPPVKLSYDRLQAVSGQCGFWPEDMSGDHENRHYWNFGCATQRNFAAQIDNPRDLITPRGETPRDGARRGTVFEKYRKGEDTATQYANQDDGKISEVAQ